MLQLLGPKRHVEEEKKVGWREDIKRLSAEEKREGTKTCKLMFFFQLSDAASNIKETHSHSRNHQNHNWFIHTLASRELC